MEIESTENRLPRRKVLQWFAAVAAAGEATSLPAFSQTPQPATVGYGTDPNMAIAYQPGDVWPLTFTPSEKKAVSALADVILPADDMGPAASELRVPDYVDEWISAPYPKQQNDRKVILPGLKWLNEEANRRFKKDFADLAIKDQQAICDDLCDPAQKNPEVRKAAGFFNTFTGLCMGAYYGTTEGWAAIGYVGNTPSGVFNGPPQEVLDQLGLEQTVKD